MVAPAPRSISSVLSAGFIVAARALPAASPLLAIAIVAELINRAAHLLPGSAQFVAALIGGPALLVGWIAFGALLVVCDETLTGRAVPAWKEAWNRVQSRFVAMAYLAGSTGVVCIVAFGLPAILLTAGIALGKQGTAPAAASILAATGGTGLVLAALLTVICLPIAGVAAATVLLERGAASDALLRAFRRCANLRILPLCAIIGALLVASFAAPIFTGFLIPWGPDDPLMIQTRLFIANAVTTVLWIPCCGWVAALTRFTEPAASN